MTTAAKRRRYNLFCAALSVCAISNRKRPRFGPASYGAVGIADRYVAHRADVLTEHVVIEALPDVPAGLIASG